MLEDIRKKLAYIPMEDAETMQYYIFYKEDVRALLSQLDKYKEGIQQIYDCGSIKQAELIAYQLLENE